MAQRLGIAAALLGDPGVLLLDEPVNGLDPAGVRWIRDLIRSLAARGRTVFVSSHLISEIALTADRLLVIDFGRLCGRDRRGADGAGRRVARRGVLRARRKGFGDLSGARAYGSREAARMEWIKLRSLRSTRWVLAGGMVATVALGVVAGYNTRNVTGDPTSNVLAGALVGQVITGVLGVLAMTSEYSSGLVRVTFAAMPRRGLVLAAKTAVFGAVCLAAGEITVVASFLGGMAALRSSVPHPSLSDPAVLRAVLMTGAYLALTGLAGLGIGAILRHGAAAVGVLVGGLFVLPLIIGAASRATGKFMPELIAGNSLAAVKPVAGFTWSPWLELGIVALYSAALLAAGGWLLVHRDA